MAEKTTKRSYGWCFTLNNPNNEDPQDDLTPLREASKYIIAGKEVGEEGTPHIQGYVYFVNKKSLAQLKKLLVRAHFEPQRGTAEQALEYCKKDGEYVEFGEPPMSKKRKGELGKEFWDEQLALAKKGRVDLCDSKVQISHFSLLTKIAAKHAPMPDDAEDTTGVWFYGPTGTGKSLKARTDYPGAYLKLCNKWWDGYNGEDTVIIEDFDRNHSVLGYHLKIWADRYSFPAEVKGSKINIRPKQIIVTSNYHPQDIWGTDPQTLDPILRRFVVIHFK